MKRYKWGIVSDLVRILKSNSDLGLNDTELENAHDDLATIMDFMIVRKCSFEKALSIYREEDEDNALWVEEALEQI